MRSVSSWRLLFKPAVEVERRETVLAVVAPDDFQIGRFPGAAGVQRGVHPGARPDRLDQVLLPDEPVEGFHLLDGVALHGCDDPLANDLQQIHEDLAA